MSFICLRRTISLAVATNQNITSLPVNSELDSEKLESLEAAFSFFNETSKQLEDSYHHLETKVQHLTRELSKAEQEKHFEFEAKNEIAGRMQALLDFLPGGVIVLDRKGIIVEANPAANTLLDTQLLGRVWRNIISECFAPRNDDGFEVSTKSGKRISISTGSLDLQGQVILLTDQTETRRLQENLSRYEKLSALGKMVSALAHQIRTPLSAAILYAGHICKDSIDNETKKEFSKKLYGRLHHMEKQIRDMMLFVKNELPLNDKISIKNLESGLKEAAEVTIQTSHCEVNWINQCGDEIIKCNREALISALMNLINNGIQATKSSPKLTINFEIKIENDSELVVSIEDNGEGMSEDSLVSAKELFYTTKSQGTGLGITVVQSVAKAHGGSLDLTSSVGQGTRASMVLPILDVENIR